MIDSKLLAEIYQHAIDDYPNECCGFIQTFNSRRCRNIADELHRKDPIRYPRTGRGSYALTIQDIRFLLDSLGTSDPVKTIYHSHPDVGAYFSAEDLAFAIFDDSPAYPVSYLVVDVGPTGVNGSKLYSFDGTTYALAVEFSKEGSTVAS